MPNHDIVVVGASAGGVDPLAKLISNLPAKFEGSLFVVLHIPAHSPSYLKEILASKSRLPVFEASDKQPIRPGTVYVAKRDFHLLIHRDFLRVVRGPRENRHRPAIDPLFRSAAAAYGRRVVGVLLSGLLDDGTAGFNAIKKAGGTLIVQDPDEAQYPDMPSNAAAMVDVDSVLTVARIAEELVRLSHEEIPVHEVLAMNKKDDEETKLAEFDMNAIQDEQRNGEPSVYSCPDCKGVLWEIKEDELVRYRCRAGHAYSMESLAVEQGEKIENALWIALTTLEERASFLRKMSSSARRKYPNFSSAFYDKRIKQAEENAETIRKILVKPETFDIEEEEEVPDKVAGSKRKNS